MKKENGSAEEEKLQEMDEKQKETTRTEQEEKEELTKEELEAEKVAERLIECFAPAQVTLTVRIRVSDMYYFLMRHAYRSISGIIGVAVSLGAIVLLLLGYGETSAQQFLLIVLALMFTVINPVSLYSRAKQQVKLTPMFQKEIVYGFGPSGIMVEQEGEKAPIPWVSVHKVIRTKKYMIIYMSKMRAFIIPLASVGENRAQLDELLETHLSAKVLKNKRAGKIKG